VLPAGEDPDSLIRKGGGETFRALIAEAKDFFDFEIERGLAGTGNQSVARRVALARRVAQFAGLVPDPVLRDTMIMRLAQRLRLPRESLDQVSLQNRRNSSGRDANFGSEANKAILPEEKIAALCHATLTDQSLLRWIREQPWLAILEPIGGTELLQKILSSAVQPEVPNSIATFFAGLEKAEVAALSQILKRRPIEESVCAEYWTKLALAELHSRRQRLLSVVRLSEGSTDERSTSLAEINEIDDLEQIIALAQSAWKTSLN
jgi:DNA primase